MSTVFVPEIGTKVVPETVVERTVTGILNLPPEGTRVRATLGETFIVGTLVNPSPYEVLYIRLDELDSHSHYNHTLTYDVWPAAGWTIEILDNEPDFGLEDFQ